MSNSVTVIFTKRKQIGSILLKFILWSKWSHCAIVTNDGTIIEASIHGVVERPLEDLVEEMSAYEMYEIPCDNPSLVIEKARSQIGKPYDFLGLFGIAFRKRNWCAEDKWVCSELIAWSFAEAGRPLVRLGSWRVTPNNLCMPIFK